MRKGAEAIPLNIWEGEEVMKTKLIRLILFSTCALLCGACGGLASGGAASSARANHLTLTYPGANKQEVALKSGGLYTMAKTLSSTSRSTKASSHYICLADHELDMSRGTISMNAPLREAGQTKVCFSLTGAEGTDAKTPLQTGTYTAVKPGPEIFQFNVAEAPSIRTFEGGQEKKHPLDASKLSGEVRITSASGDAVSGEVNLADGEREIKGAFTTRTNKR